MTTIEYKLEISDEPLDAMYLESNFGTHSWDLVTILQYNEKYYYYFKRIE